MQVEKEPKPRKWSSECLQKVARWERSQYTLQCPGMLFSTWRNQVLIFRDDTWSIKKRIDCISAYRIIELPFSSFIEVRWPLSFSCFLSCFWLRCTACEILVLQLEIKAMPPALETWNLNCWTTKEVPSDRFLSFSLFKQEARD